MARASAVLAATLAGACSTMPPVDSTPGSLVVVTRTTGLEPDADGYTVAVDGGTSQPIGINDSLTQNGLTAGAHQVAFGGLAANCVLSGANPIGATVPAGGKARITAAIACLSTRGTVAVIIQTTGSDLDFNGYEILLQGRPPVRSTVNETVSYSDLAAGSYNLTVQDIQPNCSLAGANPRPVTVVANTVTNVTVQITCTALPVGNPLGFVMSRQVIPGSPYGVAVSASGVIYAALIGSTELIRGSLATRQFTDRVVVGHTPPHVVFNNAGTRVYATLQTGQKVVAVDAATNQVVASVPLSNDGFNLLVGPNDQHVYATTANGTLYVLDATTLAPVTTMQVGAVANGLVLSPNGQTLYVTSRDAGTIKAITVATNTISRTYVVGGLLQRIAIAPDGSELYVADETGNLVVVNVGSGAVASVPQPAGSVPYGIGVTKNGAEIYLLLAVSGEIKVLNRVTRAVIRTIPVGGTLRNIVFSADGSQALVTNEGEVVFIR